MSYKEIKGNIFNSNAMAIVNTVNCVGVMGKGIALEYRLRYPDMFAEYESICNQKLLKPGQILPYRKSKPWILNFAIKDDWKQPSKAQWIESTLQKFCSNYREMGISSVAFPLMGAMNGGIPVELIWTLTREYLSEINDIDVEVYEFDSASSDRLFENLLMISSDEFIDMQTILSRSNIKKKYWVAILEAVRSNEVKSLYQLVNYKSEGKRIIGNTNVERLYHFLSLRNENKVSLF